MTTTLTPAAYKFRPGALEHIQRTRNLHADEQLAALIGIPVENLAKIRGGAPVSARLALRVAALQGDQNYLSGYFEPAHAA